MQSSPASYYFLSLRFKCELLDSFEKTSPSSVDLVGKLVFFVLVPYDEFVCPVITYNLRVLRCKEWIS
jgi:hypothetical protein